MSDKQIWFITGAGRGQPVLDQELGALVREAVARLQDQDLEHEDVIEGRATTTRAIGSRRGPLQVRPEQLEVHQPIQPLQRVALGRELPQALIEIEKPSLTPHPTTPFATTTNRES